VYRERSPAVLGPPFWCLEQDATTHAAFLSNPFLHDVDVDSYFADRLPDWDALFDNYRDAIDASIDTVVRSLVPMIADPVRVDRRYIVTHDRMRRSTGDFEFGTTLEVG